MAICGVYSKFVFMKDFNLYLNNWDYSTLRQLFQENGKKQTYCKKDFFIRQHEISRFSGWIEKGTFQYTFIDEEGIEHIVGYAFQNEFVCDYVSLIKGKESLVSIQALSSSIVYELSRYDIIDYWKTNADTQNYGRLVAESLYEVAYMRFLESYCTPEMRYRKLMKRCPTLKENIPLRSIASYLGVTPETISHIRKKILSEKKS